ncbi:MAG: hypothetical protein LUE86_01225 [Clostridiales bacterium]|nr:hypothetical protein [Clostridiales bacterium]
MPEKKREVREQMNFNQLLDEMKGSKKTFHLGSSKEFKEVQNALQEVVSLRDKTLGESREEMVRAHERLGKACDAYLKARTGAITDKGKDRLEIVEVISTLQKREADAVNTLRDPATFRSYAGSKTKWSEVLADHRANEIDVTGKELSTVGAGSSSRSVVPLGNNRKGFFTKDQALLSDDDYLKERIRTAGSENIKMAYENILAERDDLAILLDNAQSARSGSKSAVENMGILCDENLKKKIKWNEMNLGDKQKFLNELKEFAKSKDASKMLQEEAGIETGGNLPARNVASSRLASLLGQDTLLAKADLVCLRNGNELQKGVMMEEAKGLDYSAKEQHMETFGKVTDYSDPRLQIQITSLEVIDYLAGQVDRHTGNMFYQFEEDKMGNQKLIGIQGIDNDAAFGNLDPENATNKPGTLVGLKDITMVDINLMARIQVTNQASLEYIFGDILRPSEIEALGKRFEQVKEHLNNGPVKIMQQKDWDAKTADALASKKGYLSGIKPIFDKLGKEFAEEKEKERLNAKELEEKENGTSKRAERHENKNNATKTPDAQKNRNSIKIGVRGL